MFKPADRIPDFPAIEHKMLAFWQDKAIFTALRAQNDGGETWSFQDGPITANNPMGVHHAWGRTYKDVFQRYHAMHGKELRYQNGFDCQGLWVEVEVEKELGFETKRDIVEYGIDKFVNRCKERVLTFAARQTEQSIRLGYWTDWDDPDTLRELANSLKDGADKITITAPSGATVSGTPAEVIGQLGAKGNGGSYFTFAKENNYTIWSFLKKCHEGGHVYRGTDIMPWCSRCGTGLSQMEVAEGRKITKHTSVFVRFPLRDRDNEALLVWTTTPWTLTSNVAAAVNPESTYLKVRHGDWIVYMGKGNYEAARIQSLEAAGERQKHTLHSLNTILKGTADLEVLEELKGEDLIGLTYDGPFDALEAQNTPGGLSPYTDETAADKPTSKQAHRVIAWDQVGEGEGTGIVHIAPGCGAEDGHLGRELDLPVIAPLNEAGEYIDGFGEWSGRSVHGVADDIIKDLKDRGLLLAKESYPHVYPHCWRCKEELVFRLVDEWFIRMDWRERIQNLVGDIRWIPQDGEARERDWLLNMGDWMISKKRFWGLALPFWVCDDCEHFHVLGSEAELHEKATAGLDVLEGNSPHRPWVDAVTIDCEKCGGTCHRTTDVGNPWLDAGIVPYSTLFSETDPEHWEKWFPADFVVECFPGQFRNWFYALLSMSAMMTGRAPFQVLLGHALVRDERGAEMHKSSGNSIAFDEAADALGAEIMRYLFCAQNPVQNLSFPDLPKEGGKPAKLASDVRRKLLTWWNCYSFFLTYAIADDYTPTTEQPELSELDAWILSRLQGLVSDAHTAYAKFGLHVFIKSFERFVDELSNWWLRRSRNRFWGADSPDKQSAYFTFYTVLTTLNRLMAPILPFFTDDMYQNLVRSHDDASPESIHLLPFPQVQEQFVNPELEARVETVLRIKNMGLALRNDSKIKIRQPLGTMKVKPADDAERAVLLDPNSTVQILEECNFERIELVDDVSDLVSESYKANFKTLGRKYGKFMKAIATHIATQDVTALLNGGTLDLDGEAIELEAGDILVTTELPKHLVHVTQGDTIALLDTTITPELKRAGIARDVNRFIQDARKANEFEVSDRISVTWQSEDEVIVAAIIEHRDALMEWTLATSFEQADHADASESKLGKSVIKLHLAKA